MQTILVVEDEESIRVGIERMLRLEGYLVHGAEDGRSGLLEALAVRPDLVLTDIHMPFVDGFGLLAQLRQLPELLHIPVVMLTAAEDKVHARRAMTAGADDYITKPFRRDDLLGSIRAQIKKSEQRRQSFEDSVRSDLGLSPLWGASTSVHARL